MSASVLKCCSSVLAGRLTVLYAHPPACVPLPADRRGLKCRWNCGRRSSLLKLLVPALRVPLRLVPGADGEEAAGVEAPPGLDSKLAQQMAQRRGPNRCAVVYGEHAWVGLACLCTAGGCCLQLLLWHLSSGH